ncbi:MAG: bifunctional methylenetetrahydrofolate dehydrogenase/methenyltetrahydrofolate cyclohydrolase FolD [Bacteroidota bacterium]
MQLIDGKGISEAILQELRAETDAIRERRERSPHLAAVLVGKDPASETYVSHKIRACKLVGYESTLLRYSAQTTEADLLKIISTLNDDDAIDGFIVQLPLPDQIEESKVIEHIAPEKDVDGFHPINIGRMSKGLPALMPATPAGIIEMLKRTNIETSGKHCVVIGRSNIVGTPMSILMSRKAEVGNATVTLCHSRTQDLVKHTQMADILIVAAGQPEMIGPEHVKSGAVVIDVGMHRKNDPSKRAGYRLVGDVQFEAVKDIASAITPVPKGVGPMTIAMLLRNTLTAYQRRKARAGLN